MRMVRRLPWRAAKAMFTGNSLYYFDTPELAREAFFSYRLCDADVVRYAARLQNESLRSAFDALFLNLPKPKRVCAPMLVLGGELDRCIAMKEIHATARAYQTEAEIFPGVAHNMMLEPEWAVVAHRIHAWLSARGL